MTTPDQPSSRPDDPAATAPSQTRPVDRKLLELLVCPVTKASLEYRSETNELISRPARLAYPIVDGVPLMTTEAARELTDDDLS